MNTRPEYQKKIGGYDNRGQRLNQGEHRHFLESLKNPLKIHAEHEEIQDCSAP